MVYQQVRAFLGEMEFLKQYNSDSELSGAQIKDIDGKTTRVCRTVKLINVFFQLAVISHRPCC